MSTAPSSSLSSPLPKHKPSSKSASLEDDELEQGQLETTVRPHHKARLPKPKLRMNCQDLDHVGANAFFSHNNPATSLQQAVDAVLSTLYIPTKANDHIPPTRSVTVILRSMGGVAYTTGSDLDNDHKEIHFSLDYISKQSCARMRDEVQGVLVHEMVHCWQWDGCGKAPVGLTEGIADYVRLKAGLGAPHWKKDRSVGWDAGYQHTGYFLDWIDHTCGAGSVRRINQALKDEEYEEERFWVRLLGKKVGELWREYSDTLPKETSINNQKSEFPLTEEDCW